MSDLVQIIGNVATEPRHIVTTAGLPITTFRLASTSRRYDKERNIWVNGETNWYTVTSFRQLSVNSKASIHVGDRLIVQGKIHLREWKKEEKFGIYVEIEANAIGHDLSWGTSSFSRGTKNHIEPKKTNQTKEPEQTNENNLNNENIENMNPAY